MPCGIYKITNTKSGKIYIGSASNYQARLNAHRNKLRRGDHFNKHMQSSYNLHGSEFFTYELLEECAFERKELEDREQYYIDLHEACNPGKGYNKRPHASSPLGVKLSDERRKQMSELSKGHTHNRGRKVSASTLVQMHEMHKKNNIAVLQFTKAGEFVAEYESLIKAATAVGIDDSTISSVLAGRGKTAAGFMWTKKQIHELS